MKRRKKCGDAAIAEDLTRITFVAFGEFFFEALFAFFECAAQCRGGDEKGEEQDCPLPAADAEDDRPCEHRGECSVFVEAVRFVREECDEDGEEKTEKKLHRRFKGWNVGKLQVENRLIFQLGNFQLVTCNSLHRCCNNEKYRQQEKDAHQHA